MQLAGWKNFSTEDKRLLHQWKNVFRYVAGDRIILFDGSGKDYECKIRENITKHVVLDIIKACDGICPNKDVWLFQSIIKKDNFELVVEKGTEVGISHFIPFVSDRSEKKNINEERLKIIAMEASEQCGRTTLPDIYPITNIEDRIVHNKDIFLFACDGRGEDISKHFSELKKHQQIGFFIGPEGGFSDKEIEFFHKHNIPLYKYGNLTFRAETAAITLGALIVNLK